MNRLRVYCNYPIGTTNCLCARSAGHDGRHGVDIYDSMFLELEAGAVHDVARAQSTPMCADQNFIGDGI